MRTCAPTLLLAIVLLASCMTAATKQDIQDRAAQAQTTQQAITAMEATPQSPERDATLIAMRSQLAAENAALVAAKAKGEAERRADVAAKAGLVETTAAAGSPIAGMFFPPALLILGLIGSIATVVKNKYAKPEEV